MIYLSNVGISQNSLRNPLSVVPMSQYVSEGGLFNRTTLPKEAPLISIARFEDGYQMIRDGHHRACAMLIGGRKYIDWSEYLIEHYTYKRYNSVNYSAGWVTPIDPITEVRIGDLKDWKQRVKQIWDTQSPQHAIHLINTRRDLYSSKKEFDTIESLSERM